MITKSVRERQFPAPATTRRVIDTSLDAAHEKNEATMAFVNTAEVGAIHDDPSVNLAATQIVGTLIWQRSRIPVQEFHY